jgi:hypothetical protein
MYVSSSNFRFLIDDYSLILSLGPFSFATTNSISVDDCTFYGNTTITIGNRRFNIQSQEYISIC